MSEADPIVEPPADDETYAASVSEQLGDEEAEAEAQEAAAMNLKQRISRSRADKTVTLELEGEEVEFTVLSGAEEDEIQDVIDEFSDLGEESNSENWTEAEQNRRAKEYINRLREILVKHDTTDQLDHDFWQNVYGRNGTSRAAGRLLKASTESDLSEEELEQFRNQ